MLTQRDYVKHTEKWFKGKKVRTLRDLQNGFVHIPKDTVLTIDGKQSGFHLKSEPCEHCKVSVFISKVPPHDLELIEDGQTTN